MKVAIVGHGGNNFGWHFAEGFWRQGLDVEYLLLDRQFREGAEFPVIAFGAEGFDPKGAWGKWGAYFRTVIPVRRHLERSSPDLVLGMYLSSGGVVASMSGHKRVVVSAVGSDVYGKVGRPLWGAVYGAMAARARAVHVVSRPIAELLEGEAGVAREKMVVASIGVDTTLFRSVDKPGGRLRRGALGVISTRGHTDVYDQGTLVRALGLLMRSGVEPAPMVTFAHGTLAERTKALVAREGVGARVEFLPGYRLEELPGILGAQDVYVSCSLSDGTSASLLEAMAMGMTPVVSDIEANREWVEHGVNGLMFRPGDSEGLAEALVRVAADEELVERCWRLNPVIVRERGEQEQQIRRLVSLFERICSDSEV